MYGVFAYIDPVKINYIDVGKYTIYWSYGLVSKILQHDTLLAPFLAALESQVRRVDVHYPLPIHGTGIFTCMGPMGPQWVLESDEKNETPNKY